MERKRKTTSCSSPSARRALGSCSRIKLFASVRFPALVNEMAKSKRRHARYDRPDIQVPPLWRRARDANLEPPRGVSIRRNYSRGWISRRVFSCSGAGDGVSSIESWVCTRTASSSCPASHKALQDGPSPSFREAHAALAPAALNLWWDFPQIRGALSGQRGTSRLAHARLHVYHRLNLNDHTRFVAPKLGVLLVRNASQQPKSPRLRQSTTNTCAMPVIPEAH